MIVSLMPLQDAHDRRAYGSKAAALARASASGLPVPPGMVMADDAVEAVALGRATELRALAELLERYRRLAVRSSSTAEDTHATSLAGQLKSVINVVSLDGLVEAIRVVWESSRGPEIASYLQRMGSPSSCRTAVILQRLVMSDVAGVMFTVDPVTGADERVIEASWGLGEAVLGGLVTPDRVRMAPSGVVLSRSLGSKRYVVHAAVQGGTERALADSALSSTLCLDDAALRQLHELAERVQQLDPGPHDLEWGFEGAELFLLQDRPVTALS
jgi:pyruvate, water dikinase